MGGGCGNLNCASPFPSVSSFSDRPIVIYGNFLIVFFVVPERHRNCEPRHGTPICAINDTDFRLLSRATGQNTQQKTACYTPERGGQFHMSLQGLSNAELARQLLIGSGTRRFVPVRTSEVTTVNRDLTIAWLSQSEYIVVNSQRVAVKATDPDALQTIEPNVVGMACVVARRDPQINVRR
jgi:hypothetical protein